MFKRPIQVDLPYFEKHHEEKASRRSGSGRLTSLEIPRETAASTMSHPNYIIHSNTLTRRSEIFRTLNVLFTHFQYHFGTHPCALAKTAYSTPGGLGTASSCRIA